MCKKIGHRTVVSTCPLRPRQSQSTTPNRILGRQLKLIDKHHTQTFSEIKALTIIHQTHRNKITVSQMITLRNYLTLKPKNQNTRLHNGYHPYSHFTPPPIQNLPDSHNTLASALKIASKEILQRHRNIIKSVDGYIRIGNKKYNKTKRENNSQTNVIIDHGQ